MPPLVSHHKITPSVFGAAQRIAEKNEIFRRHAKTPAYFGSKRSKYTLMILDSKQSRVDVSVSTHDPLHYNGTNTGLYTGRTSPPEMFDLQAHQGAITKRAMKRTQHLKPKINFSKMLKHKKSHSREVKYEPIAGFN